MDEGYGAVSRKLIMARRAPALLAVLLLASLPQLYTVAPAISSNSLHTAPAPAALPRGITLHVDRKELFAQSARSAHRRAQDGDRGTRTSGAVSGSVIAGMYVAPVAIGTPPRVFQLQLDTGSATLAVPSSSCRDCTRGYATTDDETREVSLHDLTQLYTPERSSTGEWIGCQSRECGVGGCDGSRGAPEHQCGSSRSLGACVARQDCQDEADWHSDEDGFTFVTCDYMASIDPGCTNYHDYGQKTHCLDTCNRCEDCCTSTNGCWFAVHYLDGSGIQGRLAQDVVRIGDDWLSTVTSFGAFETFDLQRGATSPFWKKEPADGIWGLGSSEHNCKPTCQQSVLDTFRDRHGLEAVFALCAGSSVLGGSNAFDVGHVDLRKAVEGLIHYVPMVTESNFIIRGPSGARMGSMSTGAHATDWGNILVDSGASNCVFSDAVFTRLLQAAARESPLYADLWSSPTHCMIVSSCQFDLSVLPVLTLDFLDEHQTPFAISLHPRDYTIWRSGDNLCLNIRPMSAITANVDALNYGSIFGDNFFSQRYIVFDRRPGHSRIGISQSGNCHAGNSMGCTDPAATNYAPSADSDDNSCVYNTEDCPALLISTTAICAQHIAGVYRVSSDAPTIDGRAHYTSLAGTNHLYWSTSHSSWYIDPDTEPCAYWALSRTQSAHPATGSWFVYCETAERFVELDLTVEPCSNAVGCTDPAATNFAEQSRLDDGLCSYDYHCTVTGSGACPRVQFNGVFTRDSVVNGRAHYTRSSATALHIYFYVSTAGWSRWVLDDDLQPDAYLGYADSASEFPPRTGWWLYCVPGSGGFDESPSAALTYCDDPPPPHLSPPPTLPPEEFGGCTSLVLSGGCQLGSIQGVYTRVPSTVLSDQHVYRKGSMQRWVYYDSVNRRWLVDQDQDPTSAFALGSTVAPADVPPATGWTQYCGTSAGYEESTLSVACR